MKTELRSLPRSVVDVGQLAQRRTVLAETQRGLVRPCRLAALGGGDLDAVGVARRPERYGAMSTDADR